MVSKFIYGMLFASLLLTTGSSPADAGGDRLGKYSVVVWTVDDWQAEREQGQDTDYARFFKEPSVQAIAERLISGIGELVSGGLEDQPEMTDDLTMIWEHLSNLGEQMTGEFVLGVGYRMDMGMPMPDMIVDFHGPAEFGVVHQEMLTKIQTMIEAGGGPPASKRKFSIGDVEFSGIEAMPGVGLYIGQFEDHHLIGTSKNGLEEYLAEGDTAVGERFNSTRIYKLAQTHLKRGTSHGFFNMDALWNLLPMLDMALGGSEPGFGEPSEDGDLHPLPGQDPSPTFSEMKPSKIIAALGLEAISGMASSGYIEEGGVGNDIVVGLEGRPGITGLIPQANSDITIPAFVPEGTIGLSLMKYDLSNIFDIGISIGAMLQGSDPEEIAAEMEAGLQMAKMTTGIDVMELIDSIEGTFCVFTPPRKTGEPAFDPMAMMMGGGAPSFPFVIGLKLANRRAFDKLMESIGRPEMMGAALQKDEFMGRDLWSFDPLGDVPPEFAGEGPSVLPSWCVEGDWLIFSTAAEEVQAALRLIDGEGGAPFGSDKRTAAAFAKVKATQGNGISMSNVGENLSQAADLLRPLLGLLPLIAPDLASDENMLFLFDPENIPESELFRKYFGWQASRTSIVEGGLRMYTFSEQVSEAADSSQEKKEPAARGSQL
ncbi:MAG TPA: hypothetical protein EYQ08_03240 [Planctomycetes bacterium]|nr:hypothetical protein [Planctomycetota bacterium]